MLVKIPRNDTTTGVAALAKHIGKRGSTMRQGNSIERCANGQIAEGVGFELGVRFCIVQTGLIKQIAFSTIRDAPAEGFPQD
jgi:hypothetical protein